LSRPGSQTADAFPTACAWATSGAAPQLTRAFRLFQILIGKRGLPCPGAVVNIALPNKVYFMADVANKYPENTGGKYYVDNQCIDCDLCRETAPDNFKRNDDGGYSFVYKQPENPDEEARCKEAKEGCPVEAIGDNGS
jgi:ferredoxin